MDLETILSVVGGVVAGGLLASVGGAMWWGGKLKASAQRIATLVFLIQVVDIRAK